MQAREIDDLLATVAESGDRLDPATWRVVISSEQGTSYRVFVRLGADFVRVELSPYLSLPDDHVRAAVMMRELLRRNRTLTEARFTLADDDDVLIEVVVDASLPIGALAAALDAVRTAAEAHFGSLKRL
jgi:putative sensory transduction regulator